MKIPNPKTINKKRKNTMKDRRKCTNNNNTPAKILYNRKTPQFIFICG
jgi:hypothetical protein